MNHAELEAAATVACRAADRARAEIVPRFRSVSVETKADGSPVTEADRAAERAIREVLADAYPDFGLLGEEYGEQAAGAADRPHWVIDPIDGTIGFSRGIPLYSTLIALVEDGESVLGLIDLPGLDERTVGWRGGGCHRNGTPVRVSTQDRLDRAMVSHGDPFAFELAGQRHIYEHLTRKVPMLRGYTDAFGHAQVIAGGVDAMVDCYLNPWDAAATQILVEEAGGACVTRSRGKTADLVFGSPALVEQISALFEDDAPTS